MPWCADYVQCPCNECFAALPIPSLLGNNQRAKHKRWYGVPNEVLAVAEEDGAPEEEVVEVKGQEQEEDNEIEPVAGVDTVAFARDLVLVVINHGIPWKSAELVMKLVNSYVVGRDVIEKLPASVYQLKKLTQCSPGHAKLFDVCPVCDFVFLGEERVCDPCGLPPLARGKRQLIVNDISVTLHQMFGVPQLAEAFEYASTRVPGDGDVWDGQVLRGMPMGAHTL
jgi:hypothetical protein